MRSYEHFYLKAVHCESVFPNAKQQFASSHISNSIIKSSNYPFPFDMLKHECSSTSWLIQRLEEEERAGREIMSSNWQKLMVIKKGYKRSLFC